MSSSVRSQLKMSEETFDFACTTCALTNKTVEAVKYCVECIGYCCQPCVDAHKVFPTLRNHNLMEVSQGNQASGQQTRLLEIPTERCSIHVAKVLDMYCEGHEVVGCSTCFVKDHKSCPDSQIHSIPDMIDTIFKLSDCKQTQSLLKDMMVSMDSVSKSKDTKLQTLNRVKKEALDHVTVFQKVLESIVRKAAESSRQEVEAAYKELETDLLQDKLTVDNIRNDLQTTDEKLNQSDGNRGQKFVCSKLALEKIKEADSEKMKHELQLNTDAKITFVPDQPLLEYLKVLHGIGQVQKHGKQKTDFYKIKMRRDIPIKLSEDSSSCHSIGCCITLDNQLLVTDYNNKKLKRIDIHKMSVVDYCTLDSQPRGVCCISKREVAIVCPTSSYSKIQFVSIQGKMTATRQVEMSHGCYGIACNDDKLYVTDSGTSLYVYSMAGTLLKTITYDNAGNNLFISSQHVTFSGSGNQIYVGGGYSGLVCFDGRGHYMSTITDTDLRDADGVCVDGRGNVFVVGYASTDVVQFSENGKTVGVIVKQGDGLKHPRAVCFHPGLIKMFVTLQSSNVVKMFDLE